MVYSDIISLLLQPHVSAIASIVVIIASAMCVGILVKMGKGHGKVAGSNKFQPRNLLFIFAVIEIVAVAVFFENIKSWIESELLAFVAFVPGVVTLLFFFFFVWWSKNNGYQVKTGTYAKAVLPSVVLIALPIFGL